MSLIPAIHRWTIIAGDNDTGDKYIAGGGGTRTPWRWGAAKDRRKLKGTNRWYLLPAKSDTGADDVIGTVMKSCIQSHSTHPDQRPLRPPKVKFEVVLAASGASYQDVQGAYGYNFSWQFQWHQSAVSDSGGWRYHQFVPMCRKNRPLSSIQFIADEKFINGVFDTGKQFIGGVGDTGEQFIGGENEK